MMLPDSGQAGAKENEIRAIEEILREEIRLAWPDDLAFLKFQVPDIACQIVLRLDSLRAAL